MAKNHKYCTESAHFNSIMRDIKDGKRRKIHLLCGAELYRLLHGMPLRAASVVLLAFLALCLPLSALRLLPAAWGTDASALLRSMLFPALPFGAAALCPFLVGKDSLRAKVSAGAGRGALLCACAASCTACLLALYTAAFLFIVLSGAWLGFGSAGSSGYFLCYLCGAALCASCCTFCVALCCVVGERSLSLLLCLAAVPLGYTLAEGVQALALACAVQGGGAPALPLLLSLLPYLLPQGTVGALQNGAAAYPLYILLALLFSLLCLAVGRAGFRCRALA